MKFVVFKSLFVCIFVNIKHVFILMFVPQTSISSPSRYHYATATPLDLVRPNVLKTFGMKLIETLSVEVIPKVQTSN